MKNLSLNQSINELYHKVDKIENQFSGSKAIVTAFKHFINSDSFRIATQGQGTEAKTLIRYKYRFKEGKLFTGAMIDTLLKYNYKISIIPPITNQ